MQCFKWIILATPIALGGCTKVDYNNGVFADFNAAYGDIALLLLVVVPGILLSIKFAVAAHTIAKEGEGGSILTLILFPIFLAWLVMWGIVAMVDYVFIKETYGYSSEEGQKRREEAEKSRKEAAKKEAEEVEERKWKELEERCNNDKKCREDRYYKRLQRDRIYKACKDVAYEKNFGFLWVAECQSRNGWDDYIFSYDDHFNSD